MTISSGEEDAVFIKDKGRIKLHTSPAKFIDEEHEEYKSEAIQQVIVDQSKLTKSKLSNSYIENIKMTANEGLF